MVKNKKSLLLNYLSLQVFQSKHEDKQKRR
jgi:hypothetical protein